MVVPLVRHTKETIAIKYPKPWTVLTGVGWKIIRKHFGPFIATIAFFPGNGQPKYVVKRRDVTRIVKDTESNGALLIQTYKKVAAGTAINCTEAQIHIDEVIIPTHESLRDSMEALRAQMEIDKEGPMHVA